MAVPVARRDGPGLRAGRDQGRQGQVLDRLAEVALRADRPRGATWRSARRCSRHLADRTGLLRPQRRRRLRGGLRDAGQGGRQAGAPAVYPRARHRLGSQRPRFDPPRPRGHRRTRQRCRLRVHQQGVLAGRRRHQRQQAAGHTRRPHPRRGVEVRRRLRSAGGVLRVRQQEDGLGNHPAARRPLVAAAHVASARPRWAADPLRQRIVHGRGGGCARPGPDRVPAQVRQGLARSGAAQGGGAKVRLGHAALTGQKARPAAR